MSGVCVGTQMEGFEDLHFRLGESLQGPLDTDPGAGPGRECRKVRRHGGDEVRPRGKQSPQRGIAARLEFLAERSNQGHQFNVTASGTQMPVPPQRLLAPALAGCVHHQENGHDEGYRQSVECSRGNPYGCGPAVEGNGHDRCHGSQRNKGDDGGSNSQGAAVTRGSHAPKVSGCRALPPSAKRQSGNRGPGRITLKEQTHTDRAVAPDPAGPCGCGAGLTCFPRKNEEG